MRKSVWLIFIFFLFSIVACGQGELSRSKAKSLLEESIKNGQMTVTIYYGEFAGGGFIMYPQYRLMNFLKQRGYITMEFDSHDYFKVTLQPSIKPFITEAKGEDPKILNAPKVTLNIGKQSINDIVGILIKKDDSECNATADFTIKSDFTPLGKEIPKKLLAECNINLSTTGTACFVKYDDGWRLKK